MINPLLRLFSSLYAHTDTNLRIGIEATPEDTSPVTTNGDTLSSLLPDMSPRPELDEAHISTISTFSAPVSTSPIFPLASTPLENSSILSHLAYTSASPISPLTSTSLENPSILSHPDDPQSSTNERP